MTFIGYNKSALIAGWFGQVLNRYSKPFVALMNGNGTHSTLAANLSSITEGDERLLVTRQVHKERP